MEQYTNTMSRRQIRHTLDSLIEGIQIIDFNWRYLYVNTAVIGHFNNNKEEFVIPTMMEKYPGIEGSDVFRVLEDCMVNRISERLEIEFIYADPVMERWFDVSVIPVEEGICIMSLDITAHKIAEEKAEKSTRLYAFISQINQKIVRVKDEKTLFNNACQIAVEFGKFEIACVSLFNIKDKKIKLVSQFGIPPNERNEFADAFYLSDAPQEYVLQNNTFYICNDITNDTVLTDWKPFAAEHGLKSCLMLPIRKSGEVIGTFNLYSTQINFSEAEEIKLMMEMAGDISYALDMFEKAKKHAYTEELLIKSEKKFRVLIEKSLDIKTLTNEAGKVTYASPSIKKILGYTPREFMNLPFLSIFHPEDIAGFLKRRQKLIQMPGKSVNKQLRLLHKDSSWIWCEGTMTNMLHEPGIEAMVSNFNDISERKTTLLQREFDRNNLYALINNTNDLMWSVDRDFNLITSNQPFEQIIHLVTGKVIAKGENTISDTLSTDVKERLRSFYERALSGEAFTVTEYLDSPVEAWNEISFYPIRKNDEIIGTACHAHDITKRIIAKLKLEKQNNELLKTNFELDKFAYSVSHDLRSPLTSMLGIISFIEEDSREPETLEHVQMIKDSIKRLDSSIKNILSHSHNNRADLEITTIPVQKLITEIIASLSSIDTDISFEVSISEQYPFHSDKQRFSTIVENLVSNAIKYHTNDTEGRFLKIYGTSGKGYLELVFEDNGIGISRLNHKNIFDMFYRISGQIPGSGIGLYIVKETVDKLKGSITIDSEEGKGSTFILKLKNL
jgi:PAS domain S-box-containing protein